jgi:hypothetical protein
MNLKTIGAAGIAALLVGGMTVAPAHAQNLGNLLGTGGSRQKDKNNMRNIGTGLGAAAAYELLKGQGTKALILGAGAAYAGKKYEDQRKAENRASRRYVGSYHRVYRYKNGVRVGYDEVNSSGHRVARYNRVYDYTSNHYTGNYQRVSS